MTKSELQNGDVVEVRSGNKYMNVGGYLINNQAWYDLDDWTMGLLMRHGNNNLDIIAVYRDRPYTWSPDYWDSMQCIWKIDAPKIKLHIKDLDLEITEEEKQNILDQLGKS